MFTLLIGIIIGVALSLATNYLFPTVFAKLTRKAAKAAQRL